MKRNRIEIMKKEKKTGKNKKENKSEKKQKKLSLRLEKKRLRKERKLLKKQKRRDRAVRSKKSIKEMLIQQKSPMELYLERLPDEDRRKVDAFFADFNVHCQISNGEKKKFRNDFEKAFLYYDKTGVGLDDALKRLDVSNMGGFYARPPIMWFALDDAAKIYPVSMKHGQMAVFRLSVHLKEPVVPELLQIALAFTVKRFPSFAATLKKGFFWHYLDTAKRRFVAEEESDIPCQPLKVSVSGSQSFRALYWKNRISVEFFHALTDGTGGMIFLKSLLFEYLKLCGKDVKNDGSVWDINASPLEEETANAFAEVPKTKSSSGFVNKPAVQMSGRLSELRPCRIVHFKMQGEALKSAAAKYGTKITGYILAAMFIAAKASTDEFTGESSIMVPVNMRQYYPINTVRNFSMYCGIRLPISDIRDISSIIDGINTQLKEKTAKDAMSEMVTATEKLVGMIRYLPLLVKTPVARIVYGFLGDNLFTSTLSNLGVVNLPAEMSECIDGMDFVLGTFSINRAGCGLITVNGTTNLSITKMTSDPSFEEALYKVFTEDGIDVSVEGSPLYEI